MFLVTDGSVNVVCDAIVVDRQDELPAAIAAMKKLIASRGGDPNTVVINPVGRPIDVPSV